jgi:hypothetical protein
MTLQQQRAVEAFYVRGYYGMGGLGQDYDSEGPSAQQYSSAAVGVAQGTVVAANPDAPITSRIGGGIMAAGSAIALVNPLIGGIVIAVGALTTLIGGLFKPDLTKIEATRIVNQIEAQYLKPNLVAWQSAAPEHKTVSAQMAALALFDKAWAAVVQGCSNPALGTAGQHCISERQRGGSAPWCPTTTGCDWFILYRDPIANDPNVIPDPVGTDGQSVRALLDSAASGVSSTLGISPLWIGLSLIGFGLALLAVGD